jgi:hypothetical protein
MNQSSDAGCLTKQYDKMQLDPQPQTQLVGDRFHAELERRRKNHSPYSVNVEFTSEEVLEDVCPFCGAAEGSLKYPYSDYPVGGKGCVYSVECQQCGAQFVENYTLVFAGITV